MLGNSHRGGRWLDCGFSLSGRGVFRILESRGFKEVRRRGSHIVMQRCRPVGRLPCLYRITGTYVPAHKCRSSGSRGCCGQTSIECRPRSPFTLTMPLVRLTCCRLEVYNYTSEESVLLPDGERRRWRPQAHCEPDWVRTDRRRRLALLQHEGLSRWRPLWPVKWPLAIRLARTAALWRVVGCRSEVPVQGVPRAHFRGGRARQRKDTFAALP